MDVSSKLWILAYCVLSPNWREDVLSEIMKPESRFYHSAGLKLHYNTWGSPDKQPLVMLHGSHDHSRSWDWTAQALQQDYFIIAPDLRGHGDSEWARGNSYCMSDLIYDQVELVEQLDIAGCPVIAHSLGAAVIAKLMGAFDQLFSRAVLIEGLVPPEEVLEERARHPAVRLQQWVRLKQRLLSRPLRYFPDIESAVARMQEANPHLSVDRASHLAREGVRQTADGYCWKFDPALRAFTRFDFKAEESCALWQQVSAPVLLMHGEDSWASNPEEDGRARYFSRVKVVSLANAGHWLQHDQFECFIDEVKQFLLLG